MPFLPFGIAVGSRKCWIEALIWFLNSNRPWWFGAAFRRVLKPTYRANNHGLQIKGFYIVNLLYCRDGFWTQAIVKPILHRVRRRPR